MLFNSSCIVDSVITQLKLHIKAESSAYMSILKTDVAIGRSLIHIGNNNGPSTESCGTAVIIYLVVDLYPLNSTYCNRLVK